MNLAKVQKAEKDIIIINITQDIRIFQENNNEKLNKKKKKTKNENKINVSKLPCVLHSIFRIVTFEDNVIHLNLSKILYT